MEMPIALQLYSVKEDTARDFVGTLEQVAEIGYDGVEFAGYGDIPAGKMREILDRLKLRVAGSHVAVNLLTDSLQQQIEYNLEIGNKNIVCPWHVATTTQEYMELCEFLNKTGETLKKNGMKLYYHNHGHEFTIVDGVYGLDLILQNTDPELVASELDLYWVNHAGVEPLEYLQKLGGRAALLHFKDMNRKERDRTTDFGTGAIDFIPILKHVKDEAVKAKDHNRLMHGRKTANDINISDNGIEWLIIEQEHFDKPYIESVRIGYNNIKKMMNEVWR